MSQHKIQQQINAACAVSIFSGTLTAVLTFLSTSNIILFEINPWTLIDVALVYGLTYGVSRKNRVCALVLFTYFLLNSIVGYALHQRGIGLMSAFFGYCLFQGILGTFAYHQEK